MTEEARGDAEPVEKRESDSERPWPCVAATRSVPACLC